MSLMKTRNKILGFTFHNSFNLSDFNVENVENDTYYSSASLPVPSGSNILNESLNVASGSVPGNKKRS